VDLPPKKIKILLLSLEKQGCTVVEVKSGWLIRFPDGETSTTIHKTPSDVRAIKNNRARILRAGLDWPFDKN